MQPYLPGKPTLRKVRDGGVRLRGILFHAPEFATLDGQTVEIFDLGPTAETLPVFGPGGAFTAYPAPLIPRELANEYWDARSDWEAERRRFRARALAQILDAFTNHEAFMERMWGTNGSDGEDLVVERPLLTPIDAHG